MPNMPVNDTKIAAQIGSGFNSKTQQAKVIQGKSNVNEALSEQELNAKDSLYIKECSNSTIEVNAMCTKVFIERCENVKVFLNDKIITQTVEIWKCKKSYLEVNSKVQTIQVDLVEEVEITYKETEMFNRMVWSQCEELKLNFKDYSEDSDFNLRTGTALMKEANSKVDDKDQFIVRILPHKVSGKPQLLNELVVRLENGFPTTDREARIFEERQEANLQKLAKELLGEDIVLNKKKPEGPKVGRNDPCSCGSAKKYKKCCGTDVF